MNTSYQIPPARRSSIRRRVSTLALITGLAVAASATPPTQAADPPQQANPSYQILKNLKLPVAPLTQMQTQPSSQTQASESAALGTRSAFEKVTAYVRVDGIGGPVTHQNYRGWIYALGFQDGIVSDPQQPGRGAARSLSKPLTVTKPLDAASVPLRTHAMAGSFIPRVELAVLTQGGQTGSEVYRLVLDQVMVSRVETNLHQGSVVEEVDFSFARISWRFNLIDERNAHHGSLTGCWDVRANRGC